HSLPGLFDRVGIRIDAHDRAGDLRNQHGHPSVATTDVEDALSAQAGQAAEHRNLALLFIEETGHDSFSSLPHKWRRRSSALDQKFGSALELRVCGHRTA